MKKHSLFGFVKLHAALGGFVFCAVSNAQTDISQNHARDEFVLALEMNKHPLTVKCDVSQNERLEFMPLISFEGVVAKWSSDTSPFGGIVRIKTVQPSATFRTREESEIDCDRRVELLQRAVVRHFSHLWLALAPSPAVEGEFFWDSGKIFGRYNFETVKIELID